MLSILKIPRVSQCCLQAISSTGRRSNNQQSFRQIMGRRGTPNLPGLGPLPIAKPILFTGAVGATCFFGASIWQYEEMRARMAARAKQAMPYIFSQPRKTGTLRQHINVWWNSLSEGQKMFWPIFGHVSALHIAANMFVLHSFATGAVATLGKEQFLGMYLGAGVFSSLASHLYKIMLRSPGRSIGASGAIMAVLAYVCTMHPDSQLQILFLPNFTFSADNAIKFIVVLDTAGCILRWKFFDHAAHLGGALLGIVWAKWGHSIWMKREPFVTWWHDTRGSMFKDK
ncbi:hypothetical protein B566_EDAN014275 [Ephemera danica]|nr:hypothetical protein B566_EDAN014275 [Ephemera danica]